MQAFLACASLTPEAGPSALRTSLRVLRSVMASPQTRRAVLHRALPEIRGGWYGIQPSAGPASTLITEAADDELAVLAFGTLFGGHGPSSLASAVAAEWREGGQALVRSLDGCFGALLIDRRERIVYLLSDTIGRRSLRYRLLPEGILVSTHDLPIVSTGLCAPDVDPVSAGSALTFGWSIGARSLVRGIRCCDPNEYVWWKDGATGRVWDPLIRTQDRLEQRDVKGRRAKVDEMIELARTNTQFFLRANPDVNVDVTAGLDSRAVLAIALSVQPASSLTAVTAGTQSTDVRMARLLARLYRIPHRASIPSTQDVDTFAQNLRLWAYAMNGMTHGKRAVDAPPILTGRTPTLSGTGGEAYRGHYYGDLADRELRQERHMTVAQGLRDRLLRPEVLGCMHAEVVNELMERHFLHFERFTRISPITSDLLDLFYALERLGRWALDARCFWLAPTLAPFESPRMLRLAFQLPPPISNHLVLHKTILRRHARAAFYLPVNARYLLPFSSHRKGRSRAHRLMRSGLSLADNLSGRFRRLAADEPVASHDQIRSELFRALLPGGLRDLILEGRSVSQRIVDRDQLCTIIEEHVDGRADHLDVIGPLATLEEYRLMLDEAAGMRSESVATAQCSRARRPHD